MLLYTYDEKCMYVYLVFTGSISPFVTYFYDNYNYLEVDKNIAHITWFHEKKRIPNCY